MASYNEIDGLPCVCSKELLTGILRMKWGFEGFVVSDCQGIEVLAASFGGPTYNLAEDLAGAGALSLKAGTDMNLAGESYELMHLRDAVNKGTLSVEDLDQAVARILRVKFKLGLFEKPYVNTKKACCAVSSGHVQLAREAARQSIILLKNTDILPLKKNLRSIAVVGPNAHNVYNQIGDYTAPQPDGKVTTILEGIRQKVSRETKVRYAQGCGIRDMSRKGFKRAVEISKASDIIIAVVGGSSSRYSSVSYETTGAARVTAGNKDIEAECGEGFDRSELGLSGAQDELLEALHQTGKPLVVVLIKGRPLTINWIAEHARAVIDAWYPGEQGGYAIAEVLFGDYNPAGRLPVSVPKATGQLPVYYNHKPLARRPYIFSDDKPLYPFGFGLSYTRFSYSGLSICPSRIAGRTKARVSVTVSNTGKAAGDEVVQMYVTDEIASVTRPVRQLKGFTRIHLEPGEKKPVEFVLSPEELKFYDADMNYRTEPGRLKITIGGSQEDVLTEYLEIT